MKKLIEASKKVNLLEAQIAESEANVAKVENWNYALQKQLEEAKLQVEEKEDQIADLNEAKKDMNK